MGGCPTAANTEAYVEDQPDPRPWLDEAWQAGKQRQAAERARQQQEVAAAVAEEVNLLLRGKPCYQPVLDRATGYLAELRDVLLAHDDGPARRTAYQQWLDSYKDSQVFQDVWAAAQLVTDARNSHRQKVREAAALRRAQEAHSRGRAFFGQVTGQEDQPDLPDEAQPGLDPQVFLTTLKTKTEGGRRSEWVYFCPMTRGRSDPLGLAKSARRYAKQLEWEQTEGGRKLYQLDLSDEGWTRQAAAWRQQKKRTGQDVAWQAYRQEDGRVCVIHDSQKAGGAALPADAAALVNLTHRLLATVPADARVRTSPGFGGDYEGSRGDGRAKHAKRQKSDAVWGLVGQYVTSGRGLRHAAGLLDMELSPKLRGRKQVDHEDALLAMLEAGYTLVPRKAHKGALSVFDVILAGSDQPDEAAMSRLVYREDSLEDCTLSVTETPIDETWPALPDHPDSYQPVLLLEVLEGGQSWSHY